MIRIMHDFSDDSPDLPETNGKERRFRKVEIPAHLLQASIFHSQRCPSPQSICIEQPLIKLYFSGAWV